MEKKIKLIVMICLTMAGIHVINLVVNQQLNHFGIRPGELATLHHVFLAPWLHGDWAHLANNLIGFTIFSALCLLRGTAFFVQSSFIIVTLTGALVWLFARENSYHIGASGWIFGLWSLSMAIAWFQRSFFNIVIALFVAFFYGGMIWGVLPTRPYISFESHLFGAISGVIAAYVMTRPKQGRIGRYS